MKKTIVLAGLLFFAIVSSFAQQPQIEFGKVWSSSFFKDWYVSLEEPETNTDWSSFGIPAGKYSYTGEGLVYTTAKAGSNQFKSKGYELKSDRSGQFEFVNGSEGKGLVKVLFRSTADESGRTLNIFVNGSKVASVRTDSKYYTSEPIVSKSFYVKPGDVIRIGPASSNYIIKRISWESE